MARKALGLAALRFGAAFTIAAGGILWPPALKVINPAIRRRVGKRFRSLPRGPVGSTQNTRIIRHSMLVEKSFRTFIVRSGAIRGYGVLTRTFQVRDREID